MNANVITTASPSEASANLVKHNMPVIWSNCSWNSRVYKVGSPRRKLITVARNDMEIINSLQVQSAEHALYCHDINSQRESSD